MKVGRRKAGPPRPAGRGERTSAGRRTDRAENPARQRRAPAKTSTGRSRGGTPTRRPRDPHALRSGPQTAPIPRPVERAARPKSASQAKARAKARKAKAPAVIRPPLRERLLAALVTKLAAIDLRPQTVLARVPFVVLIISTLGIGLAITLWLSTEAAQRSYQLGNARSVNEALAQQKEALERDVLEAESAPALAEAARELGMIPSRDTAHLVQDPAGNWVVIGEPKPADGAPPPPLNTQLPDPKPPAPPAPTPKPGAEVEVLRRVTPPTAGALPSAASELPVRLPASGSPGTPHAVPGAVPGGAPAVTPGVVAGPAPGPLPGPLPAPVPAVVVPSPVLPVPALPTAPTAPLGAAQ